MATTAGSTRINIDLALNTRGFRPLGRINGQLGEFEKSLDASNARVLAFGASAGAILAVKKAFTTTVKAAIEVEKSLKDINVILQVSTGNLAKFGSQLFKIASETGQAFQVAATAATELARQGLGVEETLKRTKDALILARLSGMEAAEAVNALTAALNTFTKVGLDSSTIINKLANVDAAFAVSSDDLAKALGRVGAAAVSAGVDLDQLLAIVTTAQQKTARGGAVIGNSFKTIFTRIQRPRIIKELENLGVQVRNLEGDTLPAIKVLENLAKQFDNLSSAQRAQISELVGGVFQVNILKAALSDLGREQSIYNRALNISVGSTDQAIRRNSELNQTLAAQFQKTLNTFKEAAAEIGQLTLAPAMQNIFGAVNKMFDSAAGEGDLAKAGQFIGKTVFEAIGKFIGGPGLLIIGAVLFKTFANLATFATDAFRTLTGLNKNFQTQLNLQKQIFGVLSENPDLMERIRQGTLSVEDAHQLILERIEQETNALDRQLLVSQQIASNLTGAGVAFSGDFGATSGGKRKFGGKGRGKSTGYIPNFADEEVLGMMMGGYSKSQLSNPKTKRSTIHNGRGGAFSAFTNGHESVVDFTNSGGKKATAVIPPKGSDAYKEFAKNLSGGFIPNFKAQGLKGFFGVKSVKDINLNSKNLAAIEQGVASGKLRADSVGIKSIDAAVARGKKGRPVKETQKAKRLNFDVKQKYGGLALFGETGTMGTIPVNTGEITRLNRWKKDGAKYPSSIAFSNFQQKSFLGSVKDRSNRNEFSGLIKKHMSGPMMNVTNDFAQAMGLNDDAPKVTSASIKATGNALFPEGAEGSIFETAINAMTKGARAFEKGLGADSQALWDFEESSNVDKRFKKKFGYTGKLVKADAKRSLDSGAWNSIGNKIFSTVLKKDGTPKRMNDQLAVQLSEFTRGGKAGGFVPSFSALHNAVQRERSAGVPMNRIRVGTHRSLASGLNPMGVGVYNTQDEPSGLGQGVRRSLARGLNPKASGGVPNFAMAGSDPVKGNTEAMMKLGMIFMGVQTALSGLRNSLGDATKENFKLRSGLDAVEKGLMVLGGVIAAQHMLGDTKIGKKLAATNAALTGTGGDGGWRNSMPTSAGINTWADAGQTLGKGVAGARKGAGSIMASMKGGLQMGKRWDMAKQRLGGMASGMQGSMFGERIAPTTMTDAGGRKSTYSGRSAGFFRGGKETIRGPEGTRVRRTQSGAGKMARRGIAKAGMMGPGAILAAGAVGAELLNNTFNSSAKELDAATQNFKTISEATERNINALNKFGQAAEKAATVYHDNNASIGQVIRAQRDLTKQLKGLPSEVRSRISGSFDPQEVQAAIAEATAIEQTKKQSAQTRLDTAGTVRDIRKTDMISPTDIAGMAKGIQDAFGSGEGAKRQRGRDENQVKALMQGAFAGVDDQKFNDMSTEDLVKMTDMFSQIDPDSMSTEEFDQAMKDVTKTLKGLDMDPTVIDAFTKGMEEGGYSAELLSEGIRNQIQERRKSAQEEKALAPIREALIKEERKLQRAVQDSRRELELEQRIRKAVMKVQEQAAGAFLTSTGKIDQGVKVKLALGAEDRNKQFGGSLGAATTAFGKSRLTEGIKDQDKLATAQSLQADVRTVLDQAKGGGVGSLAEGATDDLVKRLEKERDSATGARRSGIDSMIKELENLNGTSVRLEKEAKDQTKEIKENAIAQKEAARQAIRLKSFGGTGSIGNPAALDPLINQIRGSEIAEGIATRTGSQAGKDSATVNRMRGLQQMFGGELPPELREQAQAAAKADKLRQIQGINETLRPGEKLTPERMEQIATEQAANLFKGDPEQQNTKALIDLTKTLETFQKRGIEGRVDIAEQAMDAADRGREGREFFEKNKKNFIRNSTKENDFLNQMNTSYDHLQDAKATAQEWGGSDEAFFGAEVARHEKRDARKGIQDAKTKMEQHSNFVENNTYNINGIKMLDTESGKLIQKVIKGMGGDLSTQTWQKAVAKHNKP